MIKIENFEVVGWEHAIRGMRNPKNSWGRSDSEFKATAETEIMEDGEIKKQLVCYDALGIGPNDHKLMMSLSCGGPVHAKYRRFIDIYVDITAPLYWWKEFDTYRAGVCPHPMDIEVNSCSTMHTVMNKKFELDDFSHEHLINHVRTTDATGAYFAMPTGTLNLIISTLNTCRIAYKDAKAKKNDELAETIWNQVIQLLPSSYNQKRTVKLTYETAANIHEWRRKIPHKLDEWRVFGEWLESLPYSEIFTGDLGERVELISEGK